jgi:hypothetical protein
MHEQDALVRSPSCLDTGDGDLSLSDQAMVALDTRDDLDGAAARVGDVDPDQGRHGLGEGEALERLGGAAATPVDVTPLTRTVMRSGKVS